MKNISILLVAMISVFFMSCGNDSMVGNAEIAPGAAQPESELSGNCKTLTLAIEENMDFRLAAAKGQTSSFRSAWSHSDHDKRCGEYSDVWSSHYFREHIEYDFNDDYASGRVIMVVQNTADHAVFRVEGRPAAHRQR